MSIFSPGTVTSMSPIQPSIGRERRRHIVQLRRVDALETNGELAVLDRRGRRAALDLGALEDVSRLEWRSIVLAEADRVRATVTSTLVVSASDRPAGQNWPTSMVPSTSSNPTGIGRSRRARATTAVRAGSRAH
ncbi:hypothetical protein [Bradyrhizobium liaoningense]